MKRFLLAAAIILHFLSGAANANTTYTYEGLDYTYAGNSNALHDPLSMANHIVFSFTTNEPLQFGNDIIYLPWTTAPITSWSFSDGTTSLSSANSAAFYDIRVQPSASATRIFDNWAISVRLETPNYPTIFNTSHIEGEQLNMGSPNNNLIYDWSQNQYGNYGGNWGPSGSWILTAVPEPEIYAMLIAGLGLLGFMARRKKSV